MSENEQYLKEHGLPRRLEFINGCIGETIGTGAFRNLFTISDCYGEYAEAVARKLVRKYNGGLLLQLHWQFDDRTEMKAQSEPLGTDKMRAWVKAVGAEHPLPEGAKWLMVNEDSEHFVWAVEPREGGFSAIRQAELSVANDTEP